MRKRWKALLRRFYRLYQEAHVPFFAAALAYYALLSLMPLLFLLVGLFGFLLSGNPALRNEVFQALTELTLALPRPPRDGPKPPRLPHPGRLP